MTITFTTVDGRVFEYDRKAGEVYEKRADYLYTVRADYGALAFEDINGGEWRILPPSPCGERPQWALERSAFRTVAIASA